jgi:thiol-disulfide isomerase/thioredoxin
VFLTHQFVSVDGVFSSLKNDLKEIEPTQESAYQNLNGEPVSLGLYKGKILVVNSWATWSPFSKDELQILSEIQDEFNDQIKVLAINRKEEIPIIKSYLRSFNILEGSITYLHDVTDHFYAVSGGYAMPETVIYKKDGTIHQHIRGTLKKEDVVKSLRSLIE